jgi:CheY-like chemotaxis protein
MTLLICDNEKPIRGLVRATLEPAGYRFVEARDGDEALALAKVERPDLILLDMMMPGRSGLDVLEALRSDPELRNVPVIMLTARTQASDQEAAERAGVTRFLAKPFSPAVLARTVAELLERARA